MSHFTSIKTKITDEQSLIQALRNMGFQPEIYAEGVELRNKWHTTDTAHIVLKREQLGVRCGADLGFKKTDSGYELTADDYELTHSSYPMFRQDFGTEYACVLAQKNGYKIVSRERGSNGKMQIKLAQPNQVKTRR